MVDNLLDIMTGGDHRKTKKLLEEKKKIREEEELEEKRLKNFIESKKTPNINGITQTASGVKSATVSPVSVSKSFGFEEQPKVELNQLKSLSDLGIDTSFIEYFGTSWSADYIWSIRWNDLAINRNVFPWIVEGQQKEEQKINEKLETTRSLLERLHQTQYERLSGPLPSHLGQIQPAGGNEHQLGTSKVVCLE